MKKQNTTDNPRRDRVPSLRVVFGAVHPNRWRRAGLSLLVIGCAVFARGEKPAGSDLRFLTDGGSALDSWPCFSPDGKSVLFSRSLNRGKSWRLFVVASAGGAPHRFDDATQLVSETRPSWSSKTGRVAFVGRTPDHGNCIWIMNADGSGLRRLSGVSNAGIYPSWYPDGTQLALTDGGELVIERVALVGGTAIPMTDRRQVMTGMCNVAPDGRWIAFAGQENAGKPYDQSKNSIWLMGTDGKSRLLENVRAEGRAPSWSPDGKRLAFESNRAGAHKHYAVYVIGRDGSGIVQVTPDELNCTHPVWAPDGTRLAFEAYRKVGGHGQGGIAVVDLLRVAH